MNKNTGGRIKKAPAGYSRDNTFSVLNAVYFASAWKVPFDPTDTSDRPFTTADGRQVTVPTMSGVQELAFAQGKGWQAVDLPYAEGFVMRLVLPDSGAPGTGVPVPCRRCAGPRRGGPVADAALPAAVGPQEHASSCARSSPDLGLREMLETETDFNAIQHGLTITQAGQSANITVAEKGTDCRRRDPDQRDRR